MAKKLDAQRIESARKQTVKRDNREEEKQHIRDTIAKNRSGERKGRVIMPEKKLYAYEEAPKIRVAAYCRVSTAEEAQVSSFEIQVQHFQSLIDSNPRYELVKICKDEGEGHCEISPQTGCGNLQMFSPNYRWVLRLFEGDCHASVSTGVTMTAYINCSLN